MLNLSSRQNVIHAVAIRPWTKTSAPSPGMPIRQKFNDCAISVSGRIAFVQAFNSPPIPLLADSQA
jgi:hypothetical protein